ncbi:hypothetical protein EB169_08295 [archaeon]|nr:hypothetical protein [archaeon]
MVKILVIGELCIDEFIYGEVKRFSPEAPVPVFNPIEKNTNMGMAGNVVSNLNFLYEDIEVLHWHQTDKITKSRYCDKVSNHMFIRIDDEKTPCDSLMYLSPNQRKTLSETDVVIVSDYDKGFLNNDMLCEIGKLGKLSIIDTKRVITQDIVDSFDFIKVNKTEYYNNKTIVDDNPKTFLITKGKEGVVFDNIIYESPNPQDTIDVSGAGDTFVAGFTLKYILSKDIIESIRYSNEICSDVVNKKGVSLPNKKYKLK